MNNLFLGDITDCVILYDYNMKKSHKTNYLLRNDDELLAFLCIINEVGSEISVPGILNDVYHSNRLFSWSMARMKD